MSTLIVIPTARAIETILFHLSAKSGWHLTLLGSGASSLAWRAQLGDEDWIVRAMNIESEKPITYPQELALLRALFAERWAVPEPISESETADLPLVAFSWAVTRHVQGRAIKAGRLPKAAAEDLGRFLHFQHHLPAEGWGWLGCKEGRFVGAQKNALDGARERWGNHPLFPLDKTSLESHSLSYNAEYFIPTLKKLVPELLEAAAYGSPAVCHSDLHGAHLFLDDGRLSGVIDFGDACLLPAAWDFAVAARYYGWEAVNHMLSVYGDSHEAEALYRQALALGVIVAVYKFNRQYRGQSPVLLRAQTLYFLQNTLEYWQGRPIS